MLDVFKIKPILFNKKIIFSLLFASLVTPVTVKNLNPILSFLIPDSKKLYLKQSYLILSWFYYLSFIENKSTQKLLKIKFLPTKINKFTTIKAPIAHKTNSKEQFKFKTHRLLYSFKNKVIEDATIESLNEAVLFFLLSKKNLPAIETNIFFLKTIKIYFMYQDSTFFKY